MLTLCEEGICLLTSLLRQLSAGSPPSGRIEWSEPSAGLRVCAFECAAPQQPALPACCETEILFCTGGSLVLSLSCGRKMRIAANEVLFLAAGCALQAAEFPEKHFSGILLSWEEAALASLCSSDYLPVFDYAQVQELLCECGGCAAIRNSVWAGAAFSALSALPEQERTAYCVFKAAELIYLLCRAGVSPAPAADNGSDLFLISAVQQVHDYMLEHLSAHLTIRFLAEEFHLSQTSLKSCFRRLYGLPIHQYLQQKRLEYAASLLVSTPLSVMEVASSIGYGSVSQFGAAFRRLYHQPPTRYRRSAGRKV